MTIFLNPIEREVLREMTPKNAIPAGEERGLSQAPQPQQGQLAPTQ